MKVYSYINFDAAAAAGAAAPGLLSKIGGIAKKGFGHFMNTTGILKDVGSNLYGTMQFVNTVKSMPGFIKGLVPQDDEEEEEETPRRSPQQPPQTPDNTGDVSGMQQENQEALQQKIDQQRQQQAAQQSRQNYFI